MEMGTARQRNFRLVGCAASRSGQRTLSNPFSNHRIEILHSFMGVTITTALTSTPPTPLVFHFCCSQPVPPLSFIPSPTTPLTLHITSLIVYPASTFRESSRILPPTALTVSQGSRAFSQKHHLAQSFLSFLSSFTHRSLRCNFPTFAISFQSFFAISPFKNGRCVQ